MSLICLQVRNHFNITNPSSKKLLGFRHAFLVGEDYVTSQIASVSSFYIASAGHTRVRGFNALGGSCHSHESFLFLSNFKKAVFADKSTKLTVA